MAFTRYTAAGTVSLVGGGAAIVLQYLVSPLSGGDLTSAEVLEEVAANRTAMAWALVFDVPLLLAVPAMLFVGALARMRTSRLAAAATALLFFPLLMSLPPVVGFDGLAYFAAAEPDRASMVHLVDSWQGSAWFAVGLVPYILCQLVGSVLMAIALVKARTVPTWAAVAVGVWPFLATAGIALGASPVAITGYVVLLAGWTACAMSLHRQAEPVRTENPLVTA